MAKLIELETDLLKLRQWQKEDFPLFAEMNADPAVMEYFPNTFSEKESNDMANKIRSLITERGWGLWAVEVKNEKKFIGFVGLHTPRAALPFMPFVEIGWRLAKSHWAKGYAAEAAKASLKVAFTKLKLMEIYSFTSTGNLRSRALMERLHMVNTNHNFDHPDVPTGHHLREHVLYKLTKDQWLKYAA